MPILTSFFRRHAGLFVLKELPCAAITAAGSYFGLAVLHHNPAIELASAFTLAVGGEYLGHMVFGKCGRDTAEEPERRKFLRLPLASWGVAAAMGVASWGMHQQFFHDHDHPAHSRHATAMQSQP